MDMRAMAGARGRLPLLAAAIALPLACAAMPVACLGGAPEGRGGRGEEGGRAGRRSSGILYVDDSVSRSGDGSGWATAYRFLQDALAFAAQPGSGITEIRVGQGIYKPDQGAGIAPGSQAATFSVPSGVQLRGGYAGFGARDPDARDIRGFESVLSGDLLGDDILAPLPQDWQHYNENSLHVVSVSSGSESTMIEGLAITAGKMDSATENIGGGLHVVGGQVTVSQCVFRHSAGYRGGGMGLKNCVATVENCTFAGNYGYYGAGGYAQNCTMKATGCAFNANMTVYGASSSGGGLGLLSGTCEVTDCQFMENASQAAGDAGAIGASWCKATIKGCIFQHNSADNGGVLHTDSGDFTFRDCQFIDNAANWAGSIWAENPSSVKCYDCSFTGSYGHFDSGAIRSAATSLFVNCSFTDSFVYWDGGGAVQGGGTFINCFFNNNQSYSQGGGAIRITAPMTLVNCAFDGNWTYGPGGAIRVNAPSPPPLATNPSLQAVNCIMASNTSVTGAGGLAAEGPASISNGIIWSNSGTAPITGSNPTLSVQFSCVEGGWPGAGNIAADPLLASLMGDDGIAGTADDDLRLLPGSPCIDAGSDLALPVDMGDLDGDNDVQETVPLDLDGLPRRVNDPATPDTGLPPNAAIVDMGPYEFQPRPAPGDANGDGQIDIDDLLAVINSWGACPVSGACPADIAPSGGDGEVDVDDLMTVINGWN